jgi:hypothetical protein
MHRALFFGMILLIINGCGVLRPKPTSTISVSNSKELLKQTQRTQPTWETLDLRGSLTARKGEISQRITTTVRISANELIWINAAVIVPLGRAKIDQSGVAFYEQIGKTFFEGDFSVIEKTLGLALDYTQIENSLRGVPVIATTARKARYASIKDGYVLKSRQGNLRLSNTYNQQFLMTKQLLTLGKQRLVIHYDDYQQISGQWIPMQISYEGQAKGETVQLEFAFRKAEINSEIRTPFSIPKSYTRL